MADLPNDSGMGFLGTGWGFPPEFPTALGGPRMALGAEDVRESLEILFGTALGERFLRPRYGLDLREALFEPVTTTMRTLLEDRARTTILVYEPRVVLRALTLDVSGLPEGRLALSVDYEIRGTNSRYNLVYPFYATDASELRGDLRAL